ncbi:MAG: metallophosphoesterase [Actinobacteria bacterium]|nr:metallophosphoesterase [Actinomycetota bacterium]
MTALLAVIAPLAVAKQPNGGPPLDAAKPATYAIIGDTPYGAPQIANFPNDIAEINADPSVSLVMHLGDIKNGSTVCSTSYFEAIRADFNQFEDPFVYTPGDNEWTDCHRANNGAYWPAGPVLNGDTRPARLAEIQRIFFDNPGWTLGRNARQVETEGGNYVENVSWNQSRTQFGAVNVPGSNNDWMPWFGQPRTSSQIAEVEGRTAADVEWIDHIFDRARANNAKAVVIGIQADMWDPEIVGDPESYDHFTPIVRELAAQTTSFGGPVLLLNGDSHKFTDDRPLADPSRPQNRSIYGIEDEVPNLRRITVNGSTTPCHEYLRLTVSPSANHPFSYQRVQFANQPGFDPAVCPGH